MADGSINIDTKIDTSGINSGVKKVNSSLDSVTKSIGSGLAGAAKIAAGAFVTVGAAMAGAITAGVKYNAKIEQLQTSFEVMTGSADKANEIIEKLKKVGAETPYELDGLAQTTQILMQYGMTADEAFNSTLGLGDISQGSAEKMQSLALALGQMSSAGKVNMQDIRQMINAGFNPLQAIAEQTGKTFAQVNAEYEAGKISVDDVKSAMAAATAEGGKYFQSMEKQSKTVNGQLSTLKDNWNQLVGAIAKSPSDQLAGGILPQINSWLVQIGSAFETDGISGLTTSLANVFSQALSGLVSSLPQFVSIITQLVNQLFASLDFTSLSTSLAQLLVTLITGLVTVLPTIIQSVLTLLGSLMIAIGEQLPVILPQITQMLISLITLLVDNIDILIDGAISIVMGIVAAMPTIIQQLVAAMPTILITLATALIASIPKILVAFYEMFKQIKTAFDNFAPNMLTIGKNLIIGLWDGIKSMASWLWDKITEFAGQIVQKFKDSFGIASPSKVFAEMGKYNALGLAEGFTNQISGLKANIQAGVGALTGQSNSYNTTLNFYTNTVTPSQLERAARRASYV